MFLEAPTCPEDKDWPTRLGEQARLESRDREVPAGGFEQVAAGAPEASGGASAEQGHHLRGWSGTEAGGEAGCRGPTGCGARTCGARVPAGSGEKARKREGLLLD